MSAVGAARRIGLIGGGLLLLQFALFNHDFTVDGLNYATAVERGEPLLHPNHLIYNALQHGLYRLLAWLPVPPRAVWSMQFLNVVAGCVAAAALARLALARSDASTAATVGGLLLAGFGFWTFSQEPEVYVLPAALVALSLVRLDRPVLTAIDAWWLALFAAAAVLLLQQYVFWYPVLLWLAWRRTPASSARAVMLIVPWLLPLLVYLCLGVANDAFISIDDALDWFLGYGWTADGLGTYRAPLPLGARTSGLLLALGNLWFAYELIATPLAWPWAAAAVVLIGCALRPLGGHGSHRATRPLLLFALLNLLFTFWWEARNIEFLLPVWLAFVAWLALNAERLRLRWLAAGTLLLFATNAALAALPQRDWPPRYRLAAALAAAEHLGADDVLLTEELNTALWLAYFERQPVRFRSGAINGVMHGESDAAAVRRAIAVDLAAGRRVYTLEFAEHGRLRALAERLPLLGRPLPAGGIDGALQRAYDGFTLQPIDSLPGVFRVLPEAPLQ